MGTNDRHSQWPDSTATRPSTGAADPGSGVAGPDGSQVLAGYAALRINRTGSPPTLVIAGEIDECSSPWLTAALSRATDGHSVIHLGLADVQYCDLAGLRAIVGLTGVSDHRPDQAARQVILHGLPAHLRTLLQILGWDTTPGLVIADGHDSRSGSAGIQTR